MTSPADRSSQALQVLSERLGTLVFPSDSSALQTRERVVRMITSYLLPRLHNPRLPLTVVFTGPTGAGKSTLINSVAGMSFSATGPIRPTTSSPVVFTTEERAGAWQSFAGVDCHVVIGRAPILSEITLIDTPDLDSTAIQHRALAETLIDNADLVVFVSSALRYADRVPWEVFRRARSRGAPVVSVLNRITPDASGALHDFARLLFKEGLSDRVIAVGEHHLPPGNDRVPSGSIRKLRKELLTRVADHRRHAEETWRRVLGATMDLALVTIGEAELFAATVDNQESSLVGAFSVGSRVPQLDNGGGELPGEEVLGLRTRWQIRRWLRRRHPTADAVARYRGKLAEDLINGELRQLRTLLAASGSTRRVTDTEYESIRYLVSDWLDAPAGIVPVPKRVAPSLIDLLIGVAAVNKTSRAMEILDVLAPRMVPTPLVEKARARLVSALASWYRQILDASLDGIPNRSAANDLKSAKDAVYEIIARFEFADA